MEFGKKQWIISGAVVVLLAGGGAGIVANNQAQAQAEKTAQEAKTAHDNLIKEAKKATEKAETFKAEADVKTAQDAIKKLDEKDKTALIARVEKVRQNWDLVNKADKAVTNAEKVQNDANVKTAQSSIDKIKDEMAKSKKSSLQGRLDKVKTAVKNNKERAKAKAAEEAKSKANAEQQKAQAAQEQAQPQNDTQAQAADVNNAVAPQAEAPASGGAVDYGQYAQAPAQNAPSYNAPAPSAPSTGGNATAPTNPPAHNGGGNANPNVSIDDANNAINDANSHPGGAPSANGGR
ncbi:MULTISPECIES: serine protease [Lactococcus]|uniref:Serine protease n=1 Tax=Lactococcus formosensis TaxID=1281486 RepID=A0A9X4PAG9_9LACT|nr:MULTISPECIES: serine protease [Lactococcus]PST74037.1 serine protease [Lactococcus garvieae]MDG6112237.1 serine protease [Lactococcus formosensis]MDG6114486.1 serine protease [Lactococcus formosensis]MDG6116631.1 serine protease [Lactococcus formosensis]MDG6118416.1 serine protease [Lactococcus formosensis]